MATKQNDKTNDIKHVDVCMNKLNQLSLIQTKHLTRLFGFNDGGKYLRRHLRKHFHANHEHSDVWVWRPNDVQLIQIVEYFVDDVRIFDDTKRLTTGSLIAEHDVNKITLK